MLLISHLYYYIIIITIIYELLLLYTELFCLYLLCINYTDFMNFKKKKSIVNLLNVCPKN